MFAAQVAADGQRLLLVRLKPPVLDVLIRAASPALPRESLHDLSVDECVRSLGRHPLRRRRANGRPGR